MKIIAFQSCQDDLTNFLAQVDKLIFFTDIDGLLTALACEHDLLEQRLFFDLSVLSLRAVLIHNGNMHPLIPIDSPGHMKETYLAIEHFLRHIPYIRVAVEV